MNIFQTIIRSKLFHDLVFQIIDLTDQQPIEISTNIRKQIHFTRQLNVDVVNSSIMIKRTMTFQKQRKWKKP
jgi:hypothetical protein